MDNENQTQTTTQGQGGQGQEPARSERYGAGGEFRGPSQGKGTSPKKKSSKGLLWGILIVVILALIAVGLFYAKPSLFGGGSDTSSEDQGPAVATVNGEKITTDEFNARYTQLTQGQELDGQQEQQAREAVLDRLISEELIMQAAADAGVSVSDQEVEQAYQDRVLPNFENEAALEEQLQANNSTLADLRENLRNQLVMQKYMDQQTQDADTSVSDQEVRDYYDQLVQQAGTSTENVPAFEDVQDRLRQQLEQQKQGEVGNQVVQRLRQDADITRNLSALDNGGNAQESGNEEGNG